MSKLDERTLANMDFVLEEVCRVFPSGGDHERRKYIAEKLKDSAERGGNTLGKLRAVAQNAIKEISNCGST